MHILKNVKEHIFSLKMTQLMGMSNMSKKHPCSFLDICGYSMDRTLLYVFHNDDNFCQQILLFDRPE